MRHRYFSPWCKAAGDSIHYVMKVDANKTYYLQVFSRADGAGAYSLTVNAGEGAQPTLDPPAHEAAPHKAKRVRH